MHRVHASSDPRFCFEGNSARLYGVLGVFTVDDRALLRDAHRKSWMAPALQFPSVRGSLAARFVARAAGAELPVLLRESQAHGDITFLNASATAPRSTGPLLTLLAWWECAVTAWPGATFIGKADDDVWIDLPRVGAHLHSTHADLCGRHPTPRVYWGLMESYSWQLETQMPVAWSYGYPHRQHNCTVGLRPSPGTRQRHSGASKEGSGAARSELIAPPTFELVEGPFPFAKGPLYFLSTNLVVEMLSETGLRAQIDAVLHRRRRNMELESKNIMPWEDAVTGMLLSRSVTGSGLYYVDVTRTVFGEGWGAYVPSRHLRSSLLFYHENFKWPGRLRVAHTWAQHHRCAKLTPATLRLDCERSAPSCANALWARCVARQESFLADDRSGGNCSLSYATHWVEEGCMLLNNEERSDPMLPSVCERAWKRFANLTDFNAAALARMQ